MHVSKKLRVFSVVAALALLAGACDGDAGEEPTGTDTGSPVAGDYDWSDVKRRQAVSMAIDREAITTTIFQGARAPADDWWPGTFVGYRGAGSCANLEYNPEAAKTLWDEAGGDAGPITIWFNSGAGHEEWTEAVANQLIENLGVSDVTFESL
jgi:peptide/nickel transport system substrate-binding protein/oligopeptide transport system substrate-binding protein